MENLPAGSRAGGRARGGRPKFSAAEPVPAGRDAWPRRDFANDGVLNAFGHDSSSLAGADAEEAARRGRRQEHDVRAAHRDGFGPGRGRLLHGFELLRPPTDSPVRSAAGSPAPATGPAALESPGTSSRVRRRSGAARRSSVVARASRRRARRPRVRPCCASDGPPCGRTRRPRAEGWRIPCRVACLRSTWARAKLASS